MYIHIETRAYYVYTSAHRTAMVYRVPDQPTDPASERESGRSPFRPSRHLVLPTTVPPAKINKGTINKNYIFFIHRRWVGARGGRERGWEGEGWKGGIVGMYAACARLRSFSSVFAGARPPALSRLPSFPSSLSLFPFFCLLRYRTSEAGFLAI